MKKGTRVGGSSKEHKRGIEKENGDIAEQVIQRTLFPRDGGNADWRIKLPRPTESDRVNKEFYALLGLILRQFVSSWYSKITEDGKFVYEIVKTVSGVVGRLEDRALSLDLDTIILDDLPYMLDAHIQDFRFAKRRHAGGLGLETLEATFKNMRPHIATQNAENEQLFLKVLAKGLTLSLLNDVEVNSACSKTLVSTIISDIALKNAVERLSEPWMIHEIIIKIIDQLTNKKKEELRDEFTEDVKLSMTQQIGLLYSQTISKIAQLVAYGGKSFAYVVSSSSSRNEREGESIPLITRSIFPLIDHILQFSERKPLLTSLISIFAQILKTDKLASTSSQVAQAAINRHVRSDELVCTILRAARETMFPNNGNMGPPRIIPNEDEQRELYEKTRSKLNALFPERMKTHVYSNDTDSVVIDLLDVFSNKQINKSLVYNVLDYAILSLVPELAE
ncbi:hypothetical protein TRICI_006286 [Trichomonascus ciferrii]|uniref:PXA domain-containing protein n=1 Tax=Trichomonascus ciferrii TaxID=44093 RepID=A0A642UQP2_9ASCO|nr:hypothetical protein TRICI_006286 [Trichomonascus ciferrii]